MRVVPISSSTGEALARYVRARANHPAAGRTDGLWLGRKGALQDSGVSQLLAHRCRLAGLPCVNPHAFRDIDFDDAPLRPIRRRTADPRGPPAARTPGTGCD